MRKLESREVNKEVDENLNNVDAKQGGNPLVSMKRV